MGQTTTRHLGELALRPDPLVAVVEGVEKPGNLGAMLRSADGAGLDAVIVTDSAIDLIDPNVIRASHGTVFAVPLAVAATVDVIAWLREHSIAIIAARMDAELGYSDADLRGPVAIALGSEAEDLSEGWSGRTSRPPPRILVLRGTAPADGRAERSATMTLQEPLSRTWRRPAGRSATGLRSHGR